MRFRNIEVTQRVAAFFHRERIFHDINNNISKHLFSEFSKNKQVLDRTFQNIFIYFQSQIELEVNLRINSSRKKDKKSSYYSGVSKTVLLLMPLEFSSLRPQGVTSGRIRNKFKTV